MHEADDVREQDQETAGAAATYIASLTEELSHLAKRNGLDALSYILDMARLEAAHVSKQSCPPRAQPQLLPPRTAN